MFGQFVINIYNLSILLKARFNRGETSNLYFWRDKNGHEIDCLIERFGGNILIEIKSGKTVTEDFFNHLEYYQKLAGVSPAHSYIIYGGDQNQPHPSGQVLAWNTPHNLFLDKNN